MQDRFAVSGNELIMRYKSMVELQKIKNGRCCKHLPFQSIYMVG